MTTCGVWLGRRNTEVHSCSHSLLCFLLPLGDRSIARFRFQQNHRRRHFGLSDPSPVPVAIFATRHLAECDGVVFSERGARRPCRNDATGKISRCDRLRISRGMVVCVSRGVLHEPPGNRGTDSESHGKTLGVTNTRGEAPHHPSCDPVPAGQQNHLPPRRPDGRGTQTSVRLPWRRSTTDSRTSCWINSAICTV